MTVATKLPADLPTLEGDSDRLEVLLAELLENAVRAVGPRGQIEVGARADGPDAVLLWVQDDGPGFPPEALPHVFDPFFTTREVGQGMGLGLRGCESIPSRRRVGRTASLRFVKNPCRRPNYDCGLSPRAARTSTAWLGPGINSQPLSECQGIAEDHGGSVAVSNPPGGGARVELRLPLAAVPRSYGIIARVGLHDRFLAGGK